MSGNDPDFIKELVDIFTEQIAEYKKEMPEMLKKGDYESLAKLAHKAKSSVAVMGMTKVAEMLKDLELKARETKDVDTYENIIDFFLTSSEKAIIELNESIN